MSEMKPCGVCGSEWQSAAEESAEIFGTSQAEERRRHAPKTVRFSLRDPGGGTFSESLCRMHRPPVSATSPFDCLHCDQCGDFLGATGPRVAHQRKARSRDEADVFGYTDVLDRPPYWIDVSLCPACASA